MAMLKNQNARQHRSICHVRIIDGNGIDMRDLDFCNYINQLNNDGLVSSLVLVRRRAKDKLRTDAIRSRLNSGIIVNCYPGTILGWLALLIRRAGSTVHFYQTFPTAIWIMALARCLFIRIIFSATDSDIREDSFLPFSRLGRIRQKIGCKLINDLIYTSAHAVVSWQQKFKNTPFHLIPDALDMARLPRLTKEEARSQLDLDPDHKIILVTPQAERDKNLYSITFEGLVDCDHVRVLWFSEHYKAPPFLGVVPVIPVYDPDMLIACCAASDIYILSSSSEAAREYILKALFYRLSLAGSYLAGITGSYIDLETTGVYASNYTRLIPQIADLLDDDKKRISYGDAGHALVRERFDWNNIRHLFHALYKRSTPPPTYGENYWKQQFCSRLSEPAVRVDPFINRGRTDTVIGRVSPGMMPEMMPEMMMVIDTESEFDWGLGHAYDHGEITAIEWMQPALGRLNRFGIKPCLVVDYPMISNDQSIGILRELNQDGCELGLHFQTWTTPPFVEPRDHWYSFSGNIGSDLERFKLQRMVQQFEDHLQIRPRIFKAGRYGISPSTWKNLTDLGFQVDLSCCPCYDFSAEGGPDYTNFDNHIRWIDSKRQLMSIPTSAGWQGFLRNLAPSLNAITRTGVARLVNSSLFLKRINALYAIRLSPEGHCLEELQALVKTLYEEEGIPLMTLSLHSPSFKPGCTPYVRNDRNLTEFLCTIESLFEWFLKDMGGQFTTPGQIYDRHRPRAKLLPPRHASQNDMPSIAPGIA